jgi:hypothetical protein
MKTIDRQILSQPKGTPLPAPERVSLLRQVRRVGERVAQAALGVNTQTLGRALGGLTIYPGSTALIRQGLAKLEAADKLDSDAENVPGAPSKS